MSIKCCVSGCQAKGQTVHRFPNPRKELALFNHWLHVLHNDELNCLRPEKVYTNRRVCFAHFKPSCKSAGNPKLHRYSVPTIGVPVIQDVDVREFVKGAVPSLFNNDTTAKSKQSFKPVRSNENDLQTNSDKIVEEPEVTRAPILFVSSSVDYKEEEEEVVVLTASNQQADTECDPLKKRIVHNPRYTGQCKIEDLESPMKRERNWNLAMGEITALRKKVNILQSQNRRLDRRVKSLRTLLRHFKKTHS